MFLVYTIHSESQEAKLIKASKEFGIYCNYDVFIDTNGISDNMNSITLQNRVYSKGGYVVLLKKGTFKRQYDEKVNPIKNQTDLIMLY